jgi:hypothetical protein
MDLEIIAVPYDQFALWKYGFFHRSFSFFFFCLNIYFCMSEFDPKKKGRGIFESITSDFTFPS